VEKVAFRDKDEWIVVPVPDAGIPLEWVDAARAMLAHRDRTQCETSSLDSCKYCSKHWDGYLH